MRWAGCLFLLLLLIARVTALAIYQVKGEVRRWPCKRRALLAEEP